MTNPLEILATSDKPVCLIFTAKWCKHCRKLSKAISSVLTEYTDRFNFIELDVDDVNNAEAVIHSKLRCVPVIMIYKNNFLITTKVGNISKSKFIQLLNSI